jgi:N5-(cytidine 5'-diphosphoramidyl)-L-glutamine hydrolase
LKNYIGISLRVVSVKKYNEKRDALSHDWTRFLEQTNSFPIFIPNTLENIEEFLTEMKINGIILSGGDNIGDFPERDKTEKNIINFAIKNKIPILGICRGMQILNQFFDGSVIITNDHKHVGKPHNVDLINTKAVELFDNQSILVNSFHNNIIKKENLGQNLIPFALSKNDETIEGFYHANLPIIGVMWHPERDDNITQESKLIEVSQKKLFWNK